MKPLEPSNPGILHTATSVSTPEFCIHPPPLNSGVLHTPTSLWPPSFRCIHIPFKPWVLHTSTPLKPQGFAHIHPFNPGSCINLRFSNPRVLHTSTTPVTQVVHTSPPFFNPGVLHTSTTPLTPGYATSPPLQPYDSAYIHILLPPGFCIHSHPINPTNLHTSTSH